MSGAAIYDPALGCEYEGWRVLGADKIGLYMPEGDCCDMTGAIRIATILMPGVSQIDTFSGDVPDTRYRLEHGRWVAYMSGLEP